MKTPAQIHRENGKLVTFSKVEIGSSFECNGNIWTKKSNRTATGIWPAILPRFAYFGQREMVYL